MSTELENQFADQLKEAEEKLRKLGRPTRSEGMVNGESGLHNNLELPYASPPKLQGPRWIQTEKALN